ncbi:hypothetical protein ACFL3J_02215, partial [Candidatus Omnitrophota bacterium]
RAVQVLKGIIIIVIVFLITKELQLETINWLMTRLFAISIIAFVIIFQPELRRGLARIGQFGKFATNIVVLWIKRKRADKCIGWRRICEWNE